MSTVKFSVRTLDQALSGFGDAWRSGSVQDHTISFASWDVMHRVLAPNRLTIVRTMTGAGPLSIREVARRVGRDFKAVHSDMAVLIQSGVVEHDGSRVVFPYDNIHVEFDISTAA